MEDGWVEYVDPATGHPYLYHAESGESRWVVAKPPAPPVGSPNGHANGAPYAAAAPHEEAEAASSSSSSSSSSSYQALFKSRRRCDDAICDSILDE